VQKAEPHYAIQDRFLDQPYTLAGRLIDPVSGMLSWQGKREHLRRKELEVLALLASAEGKQVSRDNFIAVVWQGNDLVGDRGLTNTIVFLRRSLRDEDADQPLIRTIPRRGYQLGVPVTRRAEQPDQHAGSSKEQQPVTVLVAGETIPECLGWRLLRRLSESPLSESWLAAPSEFGEREQAHRVFRFCRSETYLQRLRREVTLLRYLSQNLSERDDIVLIRDWQLDEPPYFLACDYAPGGNLHDCIQAGGLPKEPEKRLMLMQGLAEALAAVHALGVVHRRLNAETVLVDQSDAGPQLKLSAFDLGGLSDRNALAPFKITALGLTMGADESDAKLSSADDVCALALVLLQLALADAKAQPTPEYLSQVTRAQLRAPLEQCFGPAEARPSAAELAQQLRAADADTPEVTAGSAKPEPARKIDLPYRAPETLERIGPYRLIDTLGEGGMGTVYLAESREPVQRHVALKLIKAGMDTAQVLARFEAERQALALMNHVNVASVFDAGSSAAGRPYFAMEYVSGLEITAHCDQCELDFQRRIELFLQVCDGVLHAHQKGIIHRDLKPSNLLIKSAQGQPATAKIIDFGVAKSLQRRLGNLTAHTQIGSFVGTPVYSSPEQISGSAADVDTRADIYSLGVVLYELLAGVAPYSADVLASKSPVELTKMLSTQEPPPLLKRFASLEANVEVEIAQRRKMSVAQMKQTLGSDLSWIVAKCLERDPNERYASVLELQKDLRRWLENRPVEARPITWRYRVRKLVRRNWGAVTLGSVVALVLIFTTTAAVIGFVRAERALEQARAATGEAALAADFQTNQMQALDPGAMGAKLRELLLEELANVRPSQGSVITEQNRKQFKSWLQRVNFADITNKQLDDFYFKPAIMAIKRDFAQSPLLQARLRQALAQVLAFMARYKEAAEAIEPTLTVRTQQLGAENPATLKSLRTRAFIRKGLGQFAEAETDYRLALKGMREQLGARDPETLETILLLGELLLYSGKGKEAGILINEALSSYRALYGEADPQTLKSMSRLSFALLLQGRLDEAEKLGQEAINGQRKVLGSSHPETISSLSMMSQILTSRGKLDQAEAYDREVLADIQKKLGNLHSSTLIAKSNLAGSLSRTNRLDDAIVLEREVLRDSQQLLGSEHVDTLSITLFLGNWLGEAKQFDEAEPMLKEALVQLRKSLGSEHPLTLKAMFYLGRVQSDMRKLDEAENLLSEAKKGMEKAGGEGSPDTLDTMNALAHVMQFKGNFAQAEGLLTKVVEGQRRIFGEAHEKTLASIAALNELKIAASRENMPHQR
jgi:eukaryotic-like serine/threonine-protein kinase